MEAVSDHGIDTINFLSGCAVLSMAAVSLMRRRDGSGGFEYRRGTMLALGSIWGGLAGKMVFDSLLGYFNDGIVSLIQAVTLSLIMLLLIYLTLRDKIPSRPVLGNATCLVLGGGLGLMSAFLGIGGGPLNLAALSYFLSMEPLKASLHSIYIIFFAQMARLLFTFWMGAVPAYPPILLAGVIGGGIFGALIGSRIVSHMSGNQVRRLYGVVLAAVLLLSAANARHYFMGLGLN